MTTDQQMAFDILEYFLATQEAPWDRPASHDDLNTRGNPQKGCSCPLWAIANAIALVEGTARPTNLTEARAAFDRLTDRVSIK